MARKVTAIGKAAIVSREGVETRAYKDSVGIWTIGVGHTAAAGPPVPKAGMKISYAECMRLFDNDIVEYERPVDEALAGIKLTENQFDALVSICYNIGPGYFKGKKKAQFVKDIEAGRFDLAAKHIMNFTKPPEIRSRRQAEADQFRTPYATALPKGRSTDRSPIKVSTIQAPASIAPTTVPTPTSASSIAGSLGDIWHKVTGKTPNVIMALETPPGFKGDKLIFTIQAILREKGFTEVGKLDGFNGPDTRAAISSMILHEGKRVSEHTDLFKCDAETLTFVSEAKHKGVDIERQTATTADVQANAPEVMAPLGSLVKIGMSTILGGGLIGSEGLIEQAKATLDQAQGTITTVKPALDAFAGFVKWITDHPAIVLIAIGIFCLFIVGGQTARIVQMFRTKRIN